MHFICVLKASYMLSYFMLPITLRLFCTLKKKTGATCSGQPRVASDAGLSAANVCALDAVLMNGKPLAERWAHTADSAPLFLPSSPPSFPSFVFCFSSSLSVPRQWGRVAGRWERCRTADMAHFAVLPDAAQRPVPTFTVSHAISLCFPNFGS